MSDFLQQTTDQLKRQRTKQAEERILVGIAARLEGYDFTAEILDDRWGDHIIANAHHYLNEDEVAALEALVPEDEENCLIDRLAMIAEGAHKVLREFVMYLCDMYEIKPEELEVRRL